jgi:hypothetical protein
MFDRLSQLTTLSRRFDHPSVRVMARELAQLARDLEQGLPALSSPFQFPAQQGATLPGLETIETALNQPRQQRSSAVEQNDWQGFAQTIWAALARSPDASQQLLPNTPHPAAVIALRLIWGGERFAELPTAVLKPPPAGFLDKLSRLPALAEHSDPALLALAVAAWIAQIPSDSSQSELAAANTRGFMRVVAACRVVGQMRAALELEDVAAGYLAWAHLLRADLQRLTAISSGWWSPTARQPDRHTRTS